LGSGAAAELLGGSGPVSFASFAGASFGGFGSAASNETKPAGAGASVMPTAADVVSTRRSHLSRRTSPTTTNTARTLLTCCLRVIFPPVQLSELDGLDEEMVLAFKRLKKKDATTKLKALDELKVCRHRTPLIFF